MVLAAIIVLLAAGDLVLKGWIEKQDPAQFPRPLQKSGGNIQLYRNHNAGFPFGFLEKHQELVKLIPLVEISALGGFLVCLNTQKGNTAKKVGLAVLLGGGISNLYDRFVRNYVVDYFSFQFGWLKKVVFNLGDLFVFLGSAILFAAGLVDEMRRRKSESY